MVKLNISESKSMSDELKCIHVITQQQKLHFYSPMKPVLFPVLISLSGFHYNGLIKF